MSDMCAELIDIITLVPLTNKRYICSINTSTDSVAKKYAVVLNTVSDPDYCTIRVMTNKNSVIYTNDIKRAYKEKYLGD